MRCDLRREFCDGKLRLARVAAGQSAEPMLIHDKRAVMLQQIAYALIESGAFGVAFVEPIVPGVFNCALDITIEMADVSALSRRANGPQTPQHLNRHIAAGFVGVGPREVA